MTRQHTYQIDADTLDALLRYLPRVVPRGQAEADELASMVAAFARLLYGEAA